MAGNNTTQNSSLEEFYEEMHPAFIAFQCVFFILVGFLGVFGNCMALVALATTPKLRNTCTALIGNLSVVDLSSSLQQLFLFTPALLNRGFPDNMGFCKTILCLSTVNYSISLSTLIFIAVNRYLLITRPRTGYMFCCGTRKQGAVHIALIWAITFFVVVVPAISGTDSVVYDREIQSCIANEDWLFTTISLVFYVVVPAFILVPLLYGLTVCAAKASHRRVHARSHAEVGPSAGPPPPSHQPERSAVSSVPVSTINANDAVPNPRHISKREINLTRIPILVFAVFAVCWTPVFIRHVCIRFFRVSVYYRATASLFVLANSTINPYLYAWSNRNFKQAYEKLLKNLRSKCRRVP